MAVLPWACRVAADVRMMKYITRFNKHAGEDVVAGPLDFPFGRALALLNGRPAQGGLLFDFLGCLREEKVRRDGRSQDTDQRRPVRGRSLDTRNQTRVYDGGAVRLRQKGGSHVGKQSESEPIKHSRNAAITCPETGGIRGGAHRRESNKGS